jgi:hypothetical protein
MKLTINGLRKRHDRILTPLTLQNEIMERFLLIFTLHPAIKGASERRIAVPQGEG